MSKTLCTPRVVRLPALLLAALTLLTACEGVGDGSRPDPSTAKIEKFGNAVSKTKLYTCFPESAVLTVRFTGDNGIDNFTQRVKWESSDRNVLVVSNAGDPIPGESELSFNTSGRLLPLRPGTATITATGLGINTSIDFTVVDPTNVRVRAVNYGTEGATTVFLAPRTFQNLELLADFDGFTHDQTGAASWSFVNPKPEVAEFAQSGDVGSRTIQTKSAVLAPEDASLRAVPKLFGCNGHDLFKDVGLDVRVAEPESLSVEPELAEAPNRVDGVTVMAVGTTELLRVFARHRDLQGNVLKTQDLSAQTRAEVSNEDVLLPGVPRTLLTAFGTGATNPTESETVTVRYCLPGTNDDNTPSDSCRSGDAFRSETLQFRTRNDTLQSFTVSPNPATVPALGSVQLRALGSYASGLQQDITRHVGWSSSDTSLVVVSSSGRAASQRPQAGEVTITARNDKAAPTTQTLTLSVVCPDGTGEACASAPPP